MSARTDQGRAALSAKARFFMGVGRANDRRWRDENTLPLFPLSMILDAEGTLSEDAKHLVRGPTQ